MMRKLICNSRMIILALLAALSGTATLSAPLVEKTLGPNGCAECHKDETAVWKASHHFLTFRKMPRSKAARKIAQKLKIRRIKAEPLCRGCHFTTQKIRNKTRVTAGISCESCHGAGKDWEKLHSEFSGKKSKQLESKSEAAERWKNSEASGMIRPNALYKLARNCYGCHIVPKERLVNIGGHSAGGPFELVSWSQGEVRHNLWYSKGRSNRLSGFKRKRMMYLIGLAVEIETAIRAVAVATKSKAYAIRMAHRVDKARDKMAKIASALTGVRELRKIALLSHSAGLKLNNKAALSVAADKIAKETLRLLANYDGSSLARLDKFIPAQTQYKGKPAK